MGGDAAVHAMMCEVSVSKNDCEEGIDRIPYVVVVNDEDVASNKPTVMVRKKSQPNKPFKEQMTTDVLIALLCGRMLRGSRSDRCTHPGSFR
jgi:hypothetical protein